MIFCINNAVFFLRRSVSQLNLQPEELFHSQIYLQVRWVSRAGPIQKNQELSENVLSSQFEIKFAISHEFLNHLFGAHPTNPPRYDQPQELKKTSEQPSTQDYVKLLEMG